MDSNPVSCPSRGGDSETGLKRKDPMKTRGKMAIYSPKRRRNRCG